MSEDYAAQARAAVDLDDPSIEALQAFLLLAVSFTASGKGKKAYMMLGKRTYFTRGCLLIAQRTAFQWL